MKKYIKRIHRICLWCVCGILILTGCERSRNVPLDPPIYKPQLMIHCLASPLSGAQAEIRYNKPLRDEDIDLVPPLPQMEAWLLNNGERIQTFTQDSSGSFSIPAGDLILETGKDYAMEVVDLTNDRTYISGSTTLPEQPGIHSITAKRDIASFGEYALEILLEGVDQPVKAISVFPVLLDSLGQPVTQIPDGSLVKLTPWNKVRYYLWYNNDGTWSEKELLLRQRGGYQDKNDEYINANEVNVTVTYLSEELTRFVRDLDETYFSGEDIFQLVRPVYSNFKNTAGIFGVYNEIELKVEIED